MNDGENNQNTNDDKAKERAFTPRHLRLDQLIPPDTTPPEHEITERMESLKRSGMINPLTVSPADDKYKILAGRTRYFAALRLGWETVPAREADDDHDHELIELDENLSRRHETKEQRGERLLRQKEIYERLHPQARNGGDRTAERQIDVLPFAAAQAKVEGVSKRTIEREIKAAKERKKTSTSKKGTSKPATKTKKRDKNKPNLAGIKKMIEANGGEFVVEASDDTATKGLIDEYATLTRRIVVLLERLACAKNLQEQLALLDELPRARERAGELLDTIISRRPALSNASVEQSEQPAP